MVSFPLKESFGTVKYGRSLIFLYWPTNELFNFPVLHSSLRVAYYLVMFGSLKATKDGVEGSPPNGGYMFLTSYKI